MKKFILILSIVFVLFISACEKQTALSPSVLDCQKYGGTYEIITNPDGSQTGKCILPDRTVCTDEQYFKTEEGCYPNQIFKKVNK